MASGSAWGLRAVRTGAPFSLVSCLLFWTRDHGWSGMLSAEFLVWLIFSLLIGYLFGGTFWSVWRRVGGGE